MPIIPTQLLEHADGASSRGWSTMYDMKILSKYIILANGVAPTADQKEITSMFFVAGSTGHANSHAGEVYSPLLVAGQILP